MTDHTFDSAAPALASRQTTGASLLPILVVLYAVLLPREVRVEISGLLFYPDRTALLISMPWIIYKTASGAIRFVLPDFLMLVSAIWMVLAMMVVYGPADGVVSGSSLALDATLGYFLARISLQSLDNFRRVLILLAPAMFLAGFLVFLESVTMHEIVRPAAEAIFGRMPLYAYRGADVTANFANGRFATSTRLGLLRGQGPFSHSILAGLHLASLGALYGMSGIRGWPKKAGRIASFFGFFSLSSAALGSLVLSNFLMFYDWFQRRVRELNWSLAFGGVLLFLFVMQMSTNVGAIGWVQRHLVFDTSTSFYRNMIWMYGTISVENHPWFGIGFEPYERPSWMISVSVDAHWLLLAMRFGLIPALALFIATMSAIIALAKASVHVPYVDQRFFRGIAITLSVFALMMFTVTLVGSTLSWFNILLGGCVACAQRSYSLGYQPPIRSDRKASVADPVAQPA